MPGKQNTVLTGIDRISRGIPELCSKKVCCVKILYLYFAFHRTTKWLKKGSAAHTSLKFLLYDEHISKDLALCPNLRFTSELENFHSLVRSYVPKSMGLRKRRYERMVELAILDNNENSARRIKSKVCRREEVYIICNQVKDQRLSYF